MTAKEQAIADGKCPRCLRNYPDEGKKTCAECRQEIKDRKRKYKDEGRCRCGRKINRSRSGKYKYSCSYCRRKNVKHKLRLRKKLLTSKICIDGCGNPALEPHQRCKDCLRWQRNDSRLSRRIRRLQAKANRGPDSQGRFAELDRTCSLFPPNSTVPSEHSE